MRSSRSRTERGAAEKLAVRLAVQLAAQLAVRLAMQLAVQLAMLHIAGDRDLNGSSAAVLNKKIYETR